MRTALFNYLFARQNGGKFILRIEDTDKERSKKEYENNILESFKWLGLDYDELRRQSEREELYKKYLKQLIKNGHAYVSKETSEKQHSLTKSSDSREQGEEEPELASESLRTPESVARLSSSSSGSFLRSEVIRFKNPNKKIVFEDLIRGQVKFDTTDLGDFVIAKSMEEPLYHMAVVVDDFEMGVTHVVRGEEHLSNTPRQILILEALGASRPIYAHIPLILAKDRSKLSKRTGAVSTLEYRELGYLPEAVLNYLALLGWNPGTDQEIFTLDELVENFDLSKIQKGGAVFDEIKLRWVNKEHLKLQRNKIQETIAKKIQEKYKVETVHPEISQIVFEHIETLKDIDEMIGVGELEYFFREPIWNKEKICWKEVSREKTKKHLEKISEILKDKEKILSYAEEAGRGNALWPLRYALSGREKSPDPFTLIQILGQEESEKRIRKVIEIL